MTAFAKLTTTEFKLFLRDRTMVFFVVGLPLLLVVVFGTMANPSSDHDPILVFFPAAALCLGLAGLAFNTMPTILATYREKGILRRMSTTPIHPSRVLLAELLVSIVASLVTLVILVVVGNVAFGFILPKAPLAFLIAFLLGAMSLLAVGLTVAAVAPTGRGATGIGMFIFIASLFLGGVFVPKENMPAALSRIGDFTPLGATMQAIREAWNGAWPQPMQLGVMIGYIVVLGFVSSKLFRWES
jgi:ABC-2 type transport system permease protein